jgi:hypothetical protein
MYVRDNFQTINQTLWLIFLFDPDQCLYCSFHRGLTGVARILLLLSWFCFYEDHLFLVSFALAFPDFNRDDHSRWWQYVVRLGVEASHLLLLVGVELGCVVLRLLILLILLRGPVVPSVVLLGRALHHLLLLLLLLLGLLEYFRDWLAEITRPPVPKCLLLRVALRSDLFLGRLVLGSDRLFDRGVPGLFLADGLVLGLHVLV